MRQGTTRRGVLLAAMPSAALAFAPQIPPAAGNAKANTKAKPLANAGEFVRFADPVTENIVVRLTSLESASFLPAPTNRFVSIKERFLVFSSDRNGPLAPFQVDLRSANVRQLASPAHLNAQSLCLDASERWLYFLDGGRLVRLELGKNERKRGAPEELADSVANFSLAPGGSIFLLCNGRLQHLEKTGAASEPIPGAFDGATFCLAQPAGAQQGCLLVRPSSDGFEFFYAPLAGKPRLLAKGKIHSPCWSPDGGSILFLRDVPAPSGVELSEIHQAPLDGTSDSFVAPTSAFASFTPNFDAAVFVGASRSKAQPNVILLLRSAKREMTLCQHHASANVRVAPVFSPDARRVYFASDREGKPAVYSVNVERLVEPLAADGA